MSERPNGHEGREDKGIPFEVEGPLADLADEILDPDFREALSEYRKVRNRLIEEKTGMKKGGDTAGLTEKEVVDLLEQFGLKGALLEQEPDEK